MPDVPPPADVLSCAASDPEARLGLPAGPYTAAGSILPFLLACAGTGVVYGAFALAGAAPGLAYLRALFCERGPIPYVETFFTAWCLGVLWVKARKIRVQRRALAFNLAPPGRDGFILSPETVPDVLRHLERGVFDPDRFLLFARLRLVLSSLRNLGRASDVDDMLAAQADVAEGTSESSYNFARSLVWAVPVLGFIGTVLGLSEAIGSFGGVLGAEGDLDSLKRELGHVTAGLSVAFDTTLLGLVLALFAQLVLTRVKSSEERFLDDCRDYGHRQVLARLRVTPPDAPPRPEPPPAGEGPPSP